MVVMSPVTGGPAMGVLAPPRLRPRLLTDVAVAAEAAGVDEIWFAEDCFSGGGISVATAAQDAREWVRVPLAAGLSASGAHLVPLSYGESLRSLVTATLDVSTLAASLQPEWIDDLAVVGSPQQCASRLLDFHEAGADAVIVVRPAGVSVDQHIADAATVAGCLRSGGIGRFYGLATSPPGVPGVFRMLWTRLAVRRWGEL